VKVLENGDEFLAEHEGGLVRESALALRLEGFERSVEEFEDDEVVVFLLAAPVHVRDAGAALHDLEDFALLQGAESLVVGPHLVLLALHEDALLGLRVDSAVEEMLVLSGYLGGEPESAD
jgi:hypothetical protein